MFESFLGGNPTNEQPTPSCASSEVGEEVGCSFFAIEDKSSQTVNLNIDAKNGLYRDLDFIKLGGNLTENTIIDLKDHSFTINDITDTTSKLNFLLRNDVFMVEYYNTINHRGAQSYLDNGVGYYLYYDNDSGRQFIAGVEPTKASIGSFSMSPSFKVKEFAAYVTSTGLLVRDEIDLIGARYAADYSAANVSNPRWLVDKGYVDNNYMTLNTNQTLAVDVDKTWVSGLNQTLNIYGGRMYVTDTSARYSEITPIRVFNSIGTSSGPSHIKSYLTNGKLTFSERFGAGGSGVTYTMDFTNDTLNGNRTVTFQNASGTVAYLSDIPSASTPNLQAVTNVGNTTTNPIIISKTSPTVDSFLRMNDGTNSVYFGLTFTGVPTIKRTSTAGTVQLRLINSTDGDVLWVTTDTMMFYSPDGSNPIRLLYYNSEAGLQATSGKILQFSSAGRSLGDMVLGLDASLTLKSYTTGTNTIVINPNSAAQTDGSGASTIKTTTVRLGLGANNRSDDLIIDSTKNFIIRDNGNTKTATFLCDASGQFRVNNVISAINHVVDYIVTPALAIDFNTGGMQSKSVAVNSTFTFSNSGNGKTVLVAITNTSGGAITVTFTGATMPVGASLSIAAGATSMFNFVTINSVIRGFEIKY